ncbi:MAG: VPLPA-CTERM-specific exosortase XrtD [Gammaproteobacteria bacterium]|nr:MAG: VPLPA-CTERM-specific exosortase XrtD [Gammaproteobacteria bacterium]
MLSLKQSGLFIIAIILALVAYWTGLSEAVFRWENQEEYSHGFLIPLVTLYILWEKKALIQASLGPPLWSSVFVIIAALIIFIMGEVSALFLLIQYSFVLLLIGLSLATVGRATKYTYVPILLLLFAIPLPFVIEVVLTAKLQLMSSWLGVEFIRLFQIPVYLEGNVIDLGVYQLQVVEACSGLRYLFPLMSLGFIAAYFYQASFWKRTIVFLATIPITILMNSFRIGAIGVMVDKWGISMAEGFLHDFEGWIIFMACAVLLFILVWALERVTNKDRSLAAVFGVVAVPNSLSRARFVATGISKPLMVIIPLLITGLLVTQLMDKRTELIPEHKEFVNFPVELEGWQGKHEKLDKEVVTKLKMTDYLLANYQSEKNQPAVNFYVAYYETQRKGVSPHSPRVCIPGGGWEINDLQRTSAGGHPVNRVIIKKGSQRQLVYYWFQGHGRIIANEYINKWYLLIDSIVKNRTDGALVRIVTNVGQNESIENADARIISFMATIEPELKHYILD